MSSDRVTRTTTTSWFSRMGNALKGILFGFVLIIGSIVLLFWNEGRAVQTARSLAEGSGLVVSVDAAKVDPANEGKLIHITGAVTPNGAPADDKFGITADGISLSRKVEMYQWKETSHSETKKNVGGSETTETTYTYDKVWSTDAIDSSSFQAQDGHQNPPMPVSSEVFTVDGGTLGAYALNRDQISNFGESKDLAPTPGKEMDILNGIGTGGLAKIANGAYVISANPDMSAVGDLRISYTITKPGPGSLIAAQVGSGVAPYQTQSGDALFLTDNGTQTAQAMFKAAADMNTYLTWGLRVLGIVLCFIGFSMLFSVLGVIGDVIPFVGSIINAGTGIIAFVLTMILCSLTIGIAWIFYRPLIGIGILVVGALIAGIVFYFRRRSTPAIQTV